MECLNSKFGFVVGSLFIIPAGHENILLISYNADIHETTTLQTATMECMMHPEHFDQTFIWLLFYLCMHTNAVQSIKMDCWGTFAFLFLLSS